MFFVFLSLFVESWPELKHPKFLVKFDEVEIYCDGEWKKATVDINDKFNAYVSSRNIWITSIYIHVIRYLKSYGRNERSRETVT